MRHTPGPWHIGMKPGPILYGPVGEQIADLRGNFLEPFEARANQQLLSAAPELCQAVEDAALTLLDIGTHKLSPEAALPIADRLNALLARLEEL